MAVVVSQNKTTSEVCHTEIFMKSLMKDFSVACYHFTHKEFLSGLASVLSATAAALSAKFVYSTSFVVFQHRSMHLQQE